MPLVAVKVKSGNAFSIYALEENGKSDLLEFLSHLKHSHSDEMAKIERYFNRTKDLGLIRNRELFKPIGNGFYEFRTWKGVRVFCFLDAGKMVICTGGYIKKTNKLAPQELARAEIWRQKYAVAKSENSLKFEDGIL
jgi:hypothetical protein